MIITNKKDISIRCDEVSSFEEGMGIADLLNIELKASPTEGIGLAANQIGINKQVFILKIPVNGELYSTGRTFINPKIIDRKIPVIFAGEGCLSFPNEIIETIRFTELTVVDILEPTGRQLTGLEAVAAEHEFDHLQGRTMYDRRKNQIGANDRCPCDSGKKFKKCCFPNLKPYAGE